MQFKSCLIDIPTFTDARGTLCVADGADGRFPFVVKRAFWIYGVPNSATRGSHAHHTCAEVIVPLCGSLVAHVDNGCDREDFLLNDQRCGLYIPPMTWCSFTDFSADCVCLCLTPEAYDEAGYINDLQTFLSEVKP